MTDHLYRETNREAWEQLAAAGCDSSQPWGPPQFNHAHEWLDPEGWLPWEDFGSVLCLACGGGQQAPLFAWLGYTVTVFDLSRSQLERDAEVAARYGLAIECVEGDMLDLSAFNGRHFDLVAQAVSACYVPDVAALYEQVASVLRPGGWYQVEHWSPLHVQLADEPWDGSAYRIARPALPGTAVPWQSYDPSTNRWLTCLHYVHPLSQLIGGLCDAGFTVQRFAERAGGDPASEPGTHPHMASFLPPFIKLLARRI
jgi:SAM-dependent methyltransferase